MTNYLYSLEKNFHSLITQFPLGKIYPKFHITVLATIPLAGAYLYYRIYKNPPINPNKIDPSSLTDPRKNAIKFGEKVVSLVKKKQEEAISFLPKMSPEKETRISPETITKVKENTVLNTQILESLKLAFQNKFEEAKESLETLKINSECNPEEMQEISRVIEREKNFINQLEIISRWSPLEPFNDVNSKDLFSPACKSWEKAMQASVKKRNAHLESFCSLIEIGLSKGWFDPASKELYEIMFAEMINEADQRLEKTLICHLSNRAYRALESRDEMKIDPKSVEIPPNAKADEALSYLCRLAKYFHRLGNHDESLQATFKEIFAILTTKPIAIDECSNIFTLVLSCFTVQQVEGRQWALSRVKNSILENREEAPQKKIQLLLVLQNDYKLLGDLSSSDEILDIIIELINTLPQEEKKQWVKKAADALYQLQMYEKAEHLIKTHNESFKVLASPIPLIQSISLGVLALCTLFVRPLYPLFACVIVPLVPTLLGTTADSKQHRT